jgi:hypothetical protein
MQLSLTIKGLPLEFAWPFVQVGRWSFWLERTGHKPEKVRQGGTTKPALWEVWHDEADAGSVHVFALGRRLIVSRARLGSSVRGFLGSPRKASAGAAFKGVPLEALYSPTKPRLKRPHPLCLRAEKTQPRQS